jgi:hypothetical protein
LTKSTASVGAVAAILVAAGTALTTAPADPGTISLTGAGHPRCTALPFATTHRNAEIRVWVGALAGGSRNWWELEMRSVPAGSYRVRWCGESVLPGKVAPGAYRWHVRARLRLTSRWGTPTDDRRLRVVR